MIFGNVFEVASVDRTPHLNGDVTWGRNEVVQKKIRMCI